MPFAHDPHRYSIGDHEETAREKNKIKFGGWRNWNIFLDGPFSARRSQRRNTHWKMNVCGCHQNEVSRFKHRNNENSFFEALFVTEKDSEFSAAKTDFLQRSVICA